MNERFFTLPAERQQLIINVERQRWKSFVYILTWETL